MIKDSHSAGEWAVRGCGSSWIVLAVPPPLLLELVTHCLRWSHSSQVSSPLLRQRLDTTSQFECSAAPFVLRICRKLSPIPLCEKVSEALKPFAVTPLSFLNITSQFGERICDGLTKCCAKPLRLRTVAGETVDVLEDVLRLLPLPWTGEIVEDFGYRPTRVRDGDLVGDESGTGTLPEETPPPSPSKSPTAGHTLAVELKPKWGALPKVKAMRLIRTNASFGDGEKTTVLLKTQLSKAQERFCRFHMMQHHKARKRQQKDVPAVEGSPRGLATTTGPHNYCPLDLFSPLNKRTNPNPNTNPNPSRTTQQSDVTFEEEPPVVPFLDAIRALSANPMNNLLLSVDGKRITSNSGEDNDAWGQCTQFLLNEFFPHLLQSRSRAVKDEPFATLWERLLGLQCANLFEAPMLKELQDTLTNLSGEGEDELRVEAVLCDLASAPSGQLHVEVQVPSVCSCRTEEEKVGLQGHHIGESRDAVDEWVTLAAGNHTDLSAFVDQEIDRFYVATTARDVSVLFHLFLSPIGDEFTECFETDSTGASLSHHWVSLSPASTGVTSKDVPFLASSTDNEFSSCSWQLWYRVGVVDLDSKRHKSLSHYAFHEKEILEAFLEGVGVPVCGTGQGPLL